MAIMKAAFCLAVITARPTLSLSCSALGSSRFSFLGRNLRPINSIAIAGNGPSGHRKKNGLCVTDFIRTEWCEKQKEFCLSEGDPEITDAMKAGISRHEELEQELIPVAASTESGCAVNSREDKWALKFLTYIYRTNQLLSEGIAREVPVFGPIQSERVTGMIDELRMHVTGGNRILTLVDTKTHVQPKLPTEPQLRNGRLQLMIYKYLWDNLVSRDFPIDQFNDNYSLDSRHILPEEIKRSIAHWGLQAETFGEVVRYFSNHCNKVLPPAHLLRLRYEHQEHNSLIEEKDVAYDEEWLQGKVRRCLEFLRGERGPLYVPDEERWKCRSLMKDISENMRAVSTRCGYLAPGTIAGGLECFVVCPQD